MKQLILCVMIALLTLAIFAEERTINDSYNFEARSDFQNALTVMNELAAKDPTDAFYRVRIGWLQYLSGNYNDAILSYQQSIRLQDSVDAHTGIINCYLALGNYTDALKVADAQLLVHKQNPTLYSKAAYAAYQKKDYALTASYYARELEYYPWDMEVRGYLVNNLYLSGQTVEAKKQYQLLKKYSPTSSIITLYKGILD